MVKYMPIKVALYVQHMWWTWAAIAAIISVWIGIDFTDPVDWGDHPDSNGHWSFISIVLLIWWIINAVGLMASLLADGDENHFYYYQRAVADSSWNERNERILAKSEGDRVNIYRITEGVKGKDKRLLASYDVAEDLEATDKAIEYAAHARADLAERKRKEKAQQKYINKEAESLARVINKG